MIFDEISDQSINDDLNTLISSCSRHISNEGFELAQHYLEHDELELAFEALFLELIEAQYIPTSFDTNKWKNIGKYLHLHEESVLDGEFWSKFINLVQGKMLSNIR
ncbi:MAG: hypothetical protein NTV43_18390 [Methylococcales bacterium]|nr:hypothetical protein [Methylococcales bacterium]